MKKALIPRRKVVSTGVASPMESVLSDLNNQRKDGSICDVTVVIDNQRFPAHKCILMATIPYFNVMFTGNFRERCQSEIRLQGVVSAEAMEVLLGAIYTPYLAISVGNVVDVTIAADFLEMEPVVTSCRNFMTSRLWVDTAAEFLQVALKLNMEELAKKAKQFINETFTLVCGTDEFKNLDFSCICEILSSHDIFTDADVCCKHNTEMTIFSAICDWAEGKKNISEQLDVLLTENKYVEYTSIPKEQLEGEVLAHRLIAQSDLRRKKVEEAIEFHNNIYGQPVSLLETGAKARGVHGYAAIGVKRANYSSNRVARPRLMFVECGCQEFDIVHEARFSAPLDPSTMCCLMHGESFVFVYGCTAKGYVFLRYNLPLRSFIKLVAPPDGVRSPMMALRKDKIYFMGGVDNKGKNIDSGFVYDIPTNTWERTPRMPAKLSCAGILMHSTNKILYIAGGYYGWGVTRCKVDTLYAYHTDTKTWYIEAPMLRKRAELSLLEIKERVYAIGGLDGKLSNKSELIEEYSVEHNEWTSVKLHGKVSCFPRRFRALVVREVLMISGVKTTCDSHAEDIEIHLSPGKSFKVLSTMSVCKTFTLDIFGSVKVPL